MKLRPQTGAVPTAPVNEFTRPFWEACRRRTLTYQYFPDTGHAQFNPAPRSRVSGSTAFEWRESCGTGTIYSWTVVWRPQSSAFEVPYAPAIIAVDEGYQMLSSVVGCEHDELAIGKRVRVVFSDISDTVTLPYFELYP